MRNVVETCSYMPMYFEIDESTAIVLILRKRNLIAIDNSNRRIIDAQCVGNISIRDRSQHQRLWLSSRQPHHHDRRIDYINNRMIGGCCVFA